MTEKDPHRPFDPTIYDPTIYEQIAQMSDGDFEEALRVREQQRQAWVAAGSPAPVIGSPGRPYGPQFGSGLPPARQSPGSLDRLQQQVDDLSHGVNTLSTQQEPLLQEVAASKAASVRALAEMQTALREIRNLDEQTRLVIEDLRTFLNQLGYQRISPVQYGTTLAVGYTLRAVNSAADGHTLTFETPQGGPAYIHVTGELGYFKTGDVFDLVLRGSTYFEKEAALNRRSPFRSQVFQGLAPALGYISSDDSDDSSDSSDYSGPDHDPDYYEYE